MVLPVDTINTELTSFVRRLNFDQLPVTQATAQFDQLSSQMSQLGTQVGQLAGGFQSITQELDIPPELLDEALTNLDAAAASFTDGAAFNLQEELGNVRGVVDRGIAMLAANPPGLEIQKAVSSLNSDLQAITEDVVEGGFLNLVVTANTPQAMAQKLAEVAQVPLTEVEAAMKEVLPQINSLQNSIGPVLENLENQLPVINNLTKEVNSFLGNARSVLNLAGSAKGILNDIVQNLSGSIKNDIRGLLSINANIPDAIFKDAVGLVSAGSFDEAANLLNRFSDLSLDDLRDGLEQINTTLARDVASTTAPTASPTPEISPTQTPERPDQPITEQGVVYGLISSVDRDITELVFRTVPLRETSISTTEALQPSDYPTYHLLIQPDGTINRSAALSTELDVPGHRQYSLGVLVGARNNRVSYDQSAAIDNILGAFFSLIPYGQVLNYSEIVVDTRPEIIFDFEDYASEHFDYRSIMNNKISSLSTEEIQQRISAAASSGTPHIDDTV